MASYSDEDSHKCVSEERLRELKEEIGKHWKDVGRKLEFSEAELDHLEVDNSKNVKEAIYQMLLRWKRRNGCNATYASLKVALNTGKKEMLPKDSLSECNDKRKLLVDHLKRTYIKWLETIRPNPTKKAQKFKLEDLFIDFGLSLLDQTRDSKDAEAWTSLKTYTALFEHPELNKKGSKIIIEGEPGSGKTTLMYYLAYLWCKNDKVMQDVKLFILLPLRRFEHGSNINKIIMNVFLRSCGNQLTETELHCILRNESGIILALDGLDEYSGLEKDDHDDSGIISIVSGESEYISPEAKVILTTRLSGLPYLHDCNVSRLKFEKLQYTHIETYVKRVFMDKEDVEKRRLILETIDANEFVADYCQLPLCLSLIVQVMRVDLQRNKAIKLDSLSNFFQYILTGLIGHLVNKSRPKLEDVKSPKLEEIAFNGLLRPSLKHIWHRYDLAGVENYDKLVEVGILVEEEDSDSDDIYSVGSTAPKIVFFLHKTFQEWYGAQHLAKLLETPTSFTEKIKQAFENPYFYLLCFTCGIGQHTALRVLDYFLQNKKFMIDKCCILFRCLAEYNGDECKLQKFISNLLTMGMALEWKKMFALLYYDDVLLLKAKLTVLRLAHQFDLTVNHVDLRQDVLTFNAPDKIMARGNLQIPPLSTEIITVKKFSGQTFFNFLRKCSKLKELRLDTDTFPGTPQEIRDRLQMKEIKVVWSTEKFGTRLSYEMTDSEWQTLSKTRCGHCGRLITGLAWGCKRCCWFYVCDSCKDHRCYAHQSQLDRIDVQPFTIRCNHCGSRSGVSYWKCRICSTFYLCNVCKSKGCHARSSLILCVEFKMEQSKHWSPKLPFRRVLELELYKILCSGCKETDVTVYGFECETCAHFHLCESCKENYPHQHKLRQQNGHAIKGCIYCIGRADDLIGRRYKGYGLCEGCWHRSIKDCEYNPLYTEHREMNKERYNWRKMYKRRYNVTTMLEKVTGIKSMEFKVINCSYCKVPAEKNEVWFRCETCPDVLLCERCRDRGIHPEHNFWRQFYRDITCEDCWIPTTLMYRCKTCHGRFVCTICRTWGYHTRHEMDVVKETELREPVSYRWVVSTLLPKTPLVHEEFKPRHCESCKVSDEVNKVWFRCEACSFFLLCERCKDQGIHSEHKLIQQGYRDINCGVCGIPAVLLYRCKNCSGKLLCIICQARCYYRQHEIEEVKDIEIHHEGFTCNQGEHPIVGTRYKCMSCDGCFNICKTCKDMGDNPNPEILNAEGRTVTCPSCRKEFFRSWSQRQSFTRCEECRAMPYRYHKNHEFKAILIPEVHHPGSCEECFGDVYGIRFECATCGVSVCRNCQVKGRHSKHDLMEIKQPELRHEVECDRCHGDIYDIRHECKKCRKYNVCKYCIDVDKSKWHTFVEISSSPWEKCSKCGGRIFAPGDFVCYWCDYIYLCEDCKLSEKKCEHEFVALRTKNVKHNYIHCNLCKEYQFIGKRYRCKICKWYNLCEYCKQSGHHKHHEFEEWKTSQFLPGPSELPYIYTWTNLDEQVRC